MVILKLHCCLSPSLHFLPLFPNSNTHSSFTPSLSLFTRRHLKASLEHSPQTSSGTPDQLHHIFLPFLQDETSIQEEEEELDPIHRFFKSRAGTRDTDREGRIHLNKNRSLSWTSADAEETIVENVNDDDDAVKDVVDEGLDSGVSNLSAAEETIVENVNDDDDAVKDVVFEGLDSGLSGVSNLSAQDGVFGEILSIAKTLPGNSTLSDFLGPFVGKLSEKDCVLMLGRMGEEGLAVEALYFFEWMGLQEPSLVTSWAYSALFPILSRAGMSDKMMVLLKNLPPAKQFRNVSLYNSMISSLSRCGRYNDAWQVYEEMEAKNIHPDHVTCSILITLMNKKGHSAKDAWQFFERMNRKGVKWSLEVLGALIKSFCDEGLKNEALIIMSEMEKKGVSPNAIIYNTLIDAYSKSNQVEEAEGLFTEMKEKGLKPTIVSYNILMDAYSRRMQPDIVENLLSEMQTLDLKPNVNSYTCLISAYGRQRKMSNMATDAFLRMRKGGISPTSHSYTALIHAYSVGGWHEKAYSAFENMKRDGIKPSVETYTALLDAFRRSGDVQMLLEVWKLMIKDKIEGTRVTFNILVDGLAKQGHYVEARDVISEYVRIGISPTVMTYNMLMNAYARGGQHSKLPQLLKEMATLNLEPDSITYSTMIYAYVRVRDFSRAFYYHKEMVKSRKVPDVKSYEKLRAILDVKAAKKNKRDRSAILGIVNSTMGLKPKKRGKKDEFWKNKKKRIMTNRSSNGLT